MGQNQVIPIGGEMPTADGPIVPIGGEMPSAAATFRTSNAVDAQGRPIVTDANPIGTFAKHVGAQINPITAVQTVAQAARHPIETAKAIGAAQGALFDKARASYGQGDYLTAARHFVDYLLPIVGPALDTAADRMQSGEIAAGLGDTVGLGLALFGPEALGHVPHLRVPVANKAAVVSRLSPEETAAVRFGAERGIPIDAATATGSPFVRGVQKVAGESMLGGPVAQRARMAQQEGLARVGSELAEDAFPMMPVTPEQAGEGVRGSILSVVRDLNATASDAYGRLRAMEASPEHAARVPKPIGPVEAKAIQTRQQSSLGYSPEPQAITELRRIRAEMDAYGYEGRTWRDVGGETGGGRGVRGNAGGGHMEVQAGHAGAPVYDDILDAAPGTSSLTRKEVVRAIDSALETGHYTNAAKGALSVAERRLRGDQSLSRPILPPDAGVATTPTEVIGLAVDVGAIKSQLQPIYDRLKREGELAPLMGGKADALRALDRLVNGPDHASLSVADAALGDLKALARVDVPELRTQGQGIAAEAVKRLDAAVRMAAARGGPDVLQALEEGRAATVGKYRAAGVLEKLRQEPVQVFRQMVAPKDSGIALLREVRGVAPAKLPEIGRAYLEDLLSLATSEGGFGHQARLFSEWRKLGPETRRLLFPSEGQRAALDHFFLLAKRVAENPNPSGTAGTLLKHGEITAPAVALAGGAPMGAVASIAGSLTLGALAKVLYTPAGVKALTRGLMLELNPARATTAARTAAAADVVKAARDAGVVLPKAADQTNQSRR